MGRLLAQVASPRVLNHAWRFVRNDPGLWVRGMPMEVMQRNLVEHVGELARQLANETYRPACMRCFYIDKADGEKRLICASDVRDKLAQRAVLAVVEPLGEALFVDASFAYRPGRTVDMALSRIRAHILEGRVWVADGDIRNCFDSIAHRSALRRLKRLTGDPAVVRLVARWLGSQPAGFRPGYGLGLPQGMVLSPFLCNLVLHDLDLFLGAQGIPFVRFADDFVLLAKSEPEARRMLMEAARGLGRLGLDLNTEKTRVVRSDKRYRFLGRRLPDGRPRFKP